MLDEEKMSRVSHYFILAVVLITAATIRFWNLDLKFFWGDEVDTTMFSLGRSFKDVPMERVVPISALDRLFVLNQEATDAEVARTVVSQDTHPPLYFCLLHIWVKLVGVSIWKLRAPAAFFGILAVAAMYALNRVAFSRAAGLMAAAMMAVSPFVVNLSQEVRHYTLAMLLVTVSLVGLVLIQKDVSERHRIRWPVWVGWMMVNSIGFYVHHFFVLAFFGQVATLIGLVWLQRRTIPARQWTMAGVAASVAALGYLLRLGTVLDQVTRSETNWLNLDYSSWLHLLSPPLLLSGTLLQMSILLPVQSQPLWMAVPLAVLMNGFGVWLLWPVYKGWRQLWQNPETRTVTVSLTGFTLCMVLGFLTEAYLLGKNVFLFPRYAVFYYPAFYGLIGASLAALPSPLPPSKTRIGRALWPLSPGRIRAIVLSVGVISSIFVVTNLANSKPFHHSEAVINSAANRSSPTLIVVAYYTRNEILFGISYAAHVRRVQSRQGGNAHTGSVSILFVDRSEGDDRIRQKILESRQSLSHPLDLWLLGWPAMPDETAGPGCRPVPSQQYWWVRRELTPFAPYQCQEVPRQL